MSSISRSQLAKLLNLVKGLPEYRQLIEKLHDEADLDVWDEDLTTVALSDLMGQIEMAIEERLYNDAARKEMITTWRQEQEKKAPVATGA